MAVSRYFKVSPLVANRALIFKVFICFFLTSILQLDNSSQRHIMVLRLYHQEMSTMQVRLTRKPGQKGTKELTLLYGEKLVCVRYRYDKEKKRRYKTVEIIVEESEWIPNDALVLVKVAWGERGISYKVKKAGGVWNKSKQAWELRYDKVVELQLEDRMVKEWEGEGGI
jgi:hypothetical protein